MSALREAQKKFLQDVLGPEDAEGGMRIYKNNARLILRDLIKGVFPVTTVLLGEDFTDYMAHEFVKISPPAGGDMNGYGAAFPDFLSNVPALKQHPYVQDVARLEWLAHESYLSPLEKPLSAEDLADVADPLNMQLRLQPHVFLLRSGWPIDKLWAKISTEGKDLKNFELKPEETFVAIHREEDRIAVWPLSEGSFKFLEHLQSTPSFAFAAEAALRHEPDIRLDLMLAKMVQGGIFAVP